MALQFQPAKKYDAKLRLGLSGPTGSGKTYSALAIGTALGERVALIDTEHSSAALYADRFAFDTLALESFDPHRYIEAVQAAEQAGYDVLVIDSLSHAWAGKDGALELVDRARSRSQSGNSFTAWKDVTPLQNRLIETIIGCRMHVIVTLRSKTEWVLEADAKGKQTPRKVGMAPIQRDGVEYEFTVFGELTAEHQLLITKSRLAELADQAIDRPGEALAQQLLAWLKGAGEAPAPVAAPSPAANGIGAPSWADAPPCPQHGQSTMEHQSAGETTDGRAYKAHWRCRAADCTAGSSGKAYVVIADKLEPARAE